MPIPLFIDLHEFSGWAPRPRERKLAGMFGSGHSIVNQWHRLRLTAARGISRLLGRTMFPPVCCLCGFEGAPPDLDLCHFCQADLPWDPQCPPGLVCALRFEPPADELIRRLKYSGVTANARVLGVLLARAVRERAQPLPRLLIPVPLHDARLRERGFNQALDITRHLATELRVPFARRAVHRRRDTPSQTGLDRAQRHENVRGAFVIAGPRELARLRDAAHVAVIDDVTTTGSTLAEMKCVLLGAGVGRVDLWAVARVPSL